MTALVSDSVEGTPVCIHLGTISLFDLNMIPAQDQSLMALYRISRKDREGQSARITPSEQDSLALEAMDFVHTWSNVDNWRQHIGTSNSTLDMNTHKWKSWAGDRYHSMDSGLSSYKQGKCL